MGAAAVFETAAETPPTTRCGQYRRLPMQCVYRALIGGSAELRTPPRPALAAAASCVRVFTYSRNQPRSRASPLRYVVSSVIMPSPRLLRRITASITLPSLRARSMEVAMMAAGFRRAIESGGGSSTEALVRLLPWWSVSVAMMPELSVLCCEQ